MKSIIAITALTSLALAGPLTTYSKRSTYDLCEEAINCETYTLPNGKTGIRFIAGTEPGTEAYDNHIANSTSRRLFARDGGYSTNVQMGDTSISFGSTQPHGTNGVYHHLYDFCHEFACDSSGATIGTSYVYHQGENSGPAPSNLGLTAIAEYKSWDQRNAFVDAVVAAAGQGVQQSSVRYCFGKGTESDCDDLTVYQQTEFINVSEYTDGSPSALVGYITAQVAGGQSDDGGWCGTIGGLWGAISSAVADVNPAIPLFFAVVSAACQ